MEPRTMDNYVTADCYESHTVIASLLN